MLPRAGYGPELTITNYPFSFTIVLPLGPWEGFGIDRVLVLLTPQNIVVMQVFAVTLNRYYTAV